MKNRATGKTNAKVVESTDAATLQGFVYDNTENGAEFYTDEAAAYKGMVGVEHETVKHCASEYVNGIAHTNGMESFWAVLKRACHGTYHQFSRNNSSAMWLNSPTSSILVR